MKPRSHFGSYPVEGANKIPGNEAPQIERRFEQIIGHSPCA